MKKIALISDIHGNLPALHAVLDDINNNFKADEIYCLGDLVDAAPWHNEVIELLHAQNIPTVLGNHDERIAINGKVIPLAKHGPEESAARIKAIEYTKQSTLANNRKFLQQLPNSIELEYAGIKMLLVHGSPLNNRHYIYEDHDQHEIAQWFLDYNADYIFTGHTHLSYIRSISLNQSNKTGCIVNVGSVGRSKEKIGAKAVYAWLTIEKNGASHCEIRKIDFDVQKTIQGIKESPIDDFYARFFEKHLLED